MNLVPLSTFTIVRQIANITDTNTYYVKAIVRNLATGKTLATINLTNQGNQRFTAPYQVPADTSGQGMYISITTYVYDDAGYTTSDQNYSTEDAEYLVIQPPVSTFGNGGTVIDYDRIKKDVLGGIKFPGIPTYEKEFKQIREYHDGRFKEIDGKIGSLKFPEYDDKDVRKEIALMKKEMQAMSGEHMRHISELKETHKRTIEELKNHFNSVIKSSNSSVEKALKANTESGDNFTSTHGKKMEEINDNYKKLYNLFATFVDSAPLEKPKAIRSDIEIRVRKLIGA